jgi:hypothetical protein
MAEPVLSFRCGDAKGDRPLTAVEATIDYLQQAAGTICNHDLAFRF